MNDKIVSIPQVLHDLSLEAARVSLSRDDQVHEVDADKIAKALLNKYCTAWSYLLKAATPILEQQATS